jgi:hypothetical protein
MYMEWGRFSTIYDCIVAWIVRWNARPGAPMPADRYRGGDAPFFLFFFPFFLDDGMAFLV